jgi:long-chain acyl-CoA synthetase
MQEILTNGKSDIHRLSYLKYKDEWYYKPLINPPEMSLGQMLKESARKYGARVAVTQDNTDLTFGDLDALSDQFAAFLQDAGVKKRDRVATQLPNSLVHVIVYFGIIKLGAISVPFNVMYKKQEMEYILNNSGAKLFVLDHELLENYLEIKNRVPVTTVVSCRPEDSPFSPTNTSKVNRKDFSGVNFYEFRETLKSPRGFAEHPEDISPKEALQLILYTAGTTGPPKGVMLTHYNFLFNLENRACTTHYQDGITALTLFPMFHVSGYMLYLLFTIYIGGRTIIAKRFDAGKYLMLLDKYKVSLFTAPPAAYIGILNHPDLEKADLSNLIYSTGAGAPVPNSLQLKWHEKTGLDLLTGFGMTETSATAISSLSHRKNLEPGCIGMPLGGEVAIINDTGQVVPRREIGEILFRGPQVMKGYWQNPEATKEALTSDGWLHTGDMGFINDEDFVFFVDRKKELIIASGYNISPAEVENLLMAHPKIREAAVIGLPHEYRGETVKAFVVLHEEHKGKVSEEDIIAWAKDNMAAYKYPRIVEFVEELPKSEAQKVLRRVLRDKELEKSGGKKPQQ